METIRRFLKRGRNGTIAVLLGVFSSLSAGARRQPRIELYNLNLPGGELEAEVGHLFSVAAGGSCRTPPNPNDETADVYVGRLTFDLSYSGTLPPGIEIQNTVSSYMGNSIAAITGIPTEPGHWVNIHLILSNVVCNGENYRGLESDVRIHVVGRGAVYR